jgi:hypothetical protein
MGGIITTPSWDLFIGLFFILGLSYSFILQREKVIGTLVSTYAAIIVTQVASPYVAQFFAGETTVGSVFIKANPTPFMIKSIIFALIIVLLTTRAGLAGSKVKGVLSPIEIMIYSILNSAMILSTILLFLDDGQRAVLISGSNLAQIVLKYNDLWLVSPIIILIIMGFRRGGRSSYND